jgi:tetratricopeptide (TPR) repeat protein
MPLADSELAALFPKGSAELAPPAAPLGGPTPPSAVEIPTSYEPRRFSWPGKRFVALGGAIFAAGVLVGVVGLAAVMGSRADRAPKVAAPASSVSPPAPLIPEARPAAKSAAPADAVKETPAAPRGEEPARIAMPAAESTAGAPSCRQLLGESFVERNDPKAARKETRLANRELVRGNVPEAHAAYCRAFALDRSNVDRHVNLGRLFLVRRDWEKAAKYGQSALELEPMSPRALGIVGDAWAALSRSDDARSAWLAAEKKSTASQRELELVARRNMALAKRVERLQDFSLAERLYRRVLLLQPEHLGATKGLATCLAKLGDQAAAETWAYKADMLKLRKKRGR